MLFALICTDRPEALETRLAARTAHLDYLASRAAEIVRAGAMLDDAGQPVGSLFLIEAADRAAAEAFAAADPFAHAGVFESTTVRAFRTGFSDGVRIG